MLFHPDPDCKKCRGLGWVQIGSHIGNPPERESCECISGGVMYECECCELMTCTKKLPGIGYVCETCLCHYDDDYGSCRKRLDDDHPID